VPLLANPLEGGKTPLLSPAEFAELGFTVIPYGITLILHAANAMKAAIDDVVSGAFVRRNAAMSFTDYLGVVGEPDWARLQEKYGGR
jgi:2-methylisocitrate lyase-like PEP mutase family enzyme